MATRRDVELGLQVTTAGSEGVKRLKDEVDALAKSGGDAAPAFRQLSDELDNLGEQAVALEAFDQIARDVEALSVAQASATTNANTLGAELAQLTTRTNALREAEQAALTVLRQSQEELAGKRQSLAILKANTDAAGKSEDAYKIAVRDQTLAIIAQKAEIREQVAAFQARKAETSAAVAAEKALGKEFAASTAQAQAAATALIQRDAALRDSTNTLNALGVATDDLTSSEIRLVTEVSAAEQAIRRLVQQQQEAVEASARQAREEERLSAIIQNTKREQAAAAQQQLAVERQAYAEMEAAQRRAADEAQRAANAIKQAFGTVGVKSAQDLGREIQEVRTALELLKSSGTLTGAELDRAMSTGARRIRELERSVRDATGQLTIMDRVSRSFQSTFGQTAAGFVAASAFQRLAELVGNAGRAFVNANRQLEALRLGLTTVFKDAALANRQIDLLRTTADRAGVAVGSIAQSFLRFSASLTGANIPLEQTNALFTAVTQAAGRLGLGGEQTNRVLDALGQIAAKGVVSMEELRQQLGDSLPGALSIAARGLGITEQQLIKLVESGELLARDFLPAFTEGLGGLQGEVNTFGAAIERAKNLVTLLFQSLGDAGAIDILKGALTGLSVVLGPLVIGFNTLFEVITTSIRGIAAFTATIAGGGGVTDAMAAFGEEVDKSVERQGNLIRAYRDNVLGAEAVAKATTNQTVKVAALRVAYGEVEASLKSQVEVGKAAVAARKEETQLATQLTDALGTQVQQLEAAAEGATINANAQAALAQTETTVLNVLKAKLDANAALFAQEQAALALTSATQAERDKVSEDRNRELAELQKKIDLQTEVAAKAVAVASASQIAAAAARVELQTNADNSARVRELADAYADAKTIFDALSAGRASGLVTAEELAAAEIKLGEATRLYSDALRDSIALIEANNGAREADLAITTGSANLRLAQLRSLEQTAKSIGNETLATYAKIEAKKVEIQILQAATKVQILEAQGSVAIARAKIEELRATGQLTKVKESELNTAIKLAQAKVLEAKARGEAVGIIEAEIRALRSGTKAKNDNANAANNVRNSVTGEAGSRRENARAISDENAKLVEQKRLKMDAQGFSADANGDRIAGGSEIATRTGILKFLQEAGVDEGNARRLTEEFADENGNITRIGNAGQMKYGGRGSTMSQALLKAAETVTFAENIGGATPTYSAASEAPAATSRASVPAPDPNSPSSVRTIRVEMGGTATDINVASDSDAMKLEGLIEQLANSKGRANR